MCGQQRISHLCGRDLACPARPAPALATPQGLSHSTALGLLSHAYQTLFRCPSGSDDPPRLARFRASVCLSSVRPAFRTPRQHDLQIHRSRTPPIRHRSTRLDADHPLSATSTATGTRSAAPRGRYWDYRRARAHAACVAAAWRRGGWRETPANDGCSPLRAGTFNFVQGRRRDCAMRRNCGPGRDL